MHASVRVLLLSFAILTGSLRVVAADNAQLTVFSQIPGSGALYHVTEAPNGQFVVADYGSSSAYLIPAGGGDAARFGSPFLSPTSIAFYSNDVGYSSCNPAPLASRGFCFSGAAGCVRGQEGIAPGNFNGVSLPRYILGTSGGLTSGTFYVTNGGTGEILLIDPSARSQRRIANGFTVSGSRSAEQMALNVASNRLYVVDAGKNTLVEVDVAGGQQTTLRSDLNWPFGLALLPGGNLIVSNRGDGTLSVIAPDGSMQGRYDTGLGPEALRGLLMTTKGDLLLVSDARRTIYRVNLPAPQGAKVVTVHAASLLTSALAANTIASAFGSGLSAQTIAAASPLPTQLGGVTVTVADTAGNSIAAPLFFVSPGQINYLVPAGLSPGTATVSVQKSDGSKAAGSLTIAAYAPGLFTANADGKGVPAASLTRVRPDGSRSDEAIAQYDAATGRFVALPIDLGPASDQLVLVLYGTGIRGGQSTTPAVSATIGDRAATVLYAGPQGQFDGLDQVNLLLPRELVGAGLVDVRFAVSGIAANTVQVSIR